MRPLKIFASMVIALLLAACGEDGPDPEDYVGHWSREGGYSILNVIHTSNGFHARDTSQAILEDGLFKIGEYPFAQDWRYDAEADRLRTPDGHVYRPVPADWEWGDGYDHLES